jgi:1,4-alpha-glucan branching enzyme
MLFSSFRAFELSSFRVPKFSRFRVKTESFIYFESLVYAEGVREMKREIREIKLYVKGEFEDWKDAIERVFHGYEITETENKELFEFVRQLLKKTHYSSFVVTKIYKTIEHGYIIRLFTQTENQYGGYVGTIETYATIDDIIRNAKR